VLKNRPASLALSPSDGALNAHVSSDNVITLDDDERTAMSEVGNNDLIFR
jgi:hypothetical protein